ncbi:MAG: RHS repeat-associated core domain-containing protein [Phycisphaerae bacterium]|nr:RHS repeat-associated core domain-containing protein [Phycisphaerae bacterium]
MKHHKDNEAMPKVAVAYVALGRRIEKVDAIAGTTRRYYYDDQRVAVQTQVSGSVETDDRYFVFGNYIDETLLMHVDAADLYYAHDHLYSPVALFAANGTVAERYEYDAYGSIQILNSQFLILNSSQHGNPYAFTGRERDTLDAGRRTLMYYRARTYDPEIGRFMQRDPLMYVDGMNVYEYVKSSPLKYIDPFGLSSNDECSEGDVEYDIIGRIITPYRTPPGYNDLFDSANESMFGIGLLDWIELVTMFQMNAINATNLASTLTHMGYGHLVNTGVKNILSTLKKVSNEMGKYGCEAYIKVEIKECVQKRHGLFWCKKRWVWGKPTTELHQCFDNSLAELGAYQTPKHAFDSFWDCENTYKKKMDKKINDNANYF